MADKKQIKIDKNIDFTELLDKYPESIEILMGSGMYCIGCPGAMVETLEQGAMAHGIDVDDLVNKINEKLNEKTNKVESKENNIEKRWEKLKNK